MSPPKSPMFAPNPQCDGIRKWGPLRKCLSQEGRVLMNGISALMKETQESSLRHFCHMGTQRENGHPWIRKCVLTKHQTCQHLDLGLSSLQSWGKQMCAVDKPFSLWCSVTKAQVKTDFHLLNGSRNYNTVKCSPNFSDIKFAPQIALWYIRFPWEMFQNTLNLKIISHFYYSTIA